MPKLDTLGSSVERRLKGEAKKSVSWPKSKIVTQEMLDDPDFKKQYPNATLGSEICDPVPLFLRQGEKRKDSIIDQLRNELLKEQIKQQVVEEHFQFDKMSDDQKRAFFEAESDFELPDDHPSILTAYERAGVIYEAKPEFPINPETPINQTETGSLGGVSGEPTPRPTEEPQAE